jgi:hypothetical protein
MHGLHSSTGGGEGGVQKLRRRTSTGSARVTARVMFGRTSMLMKRTSAAELNMPICAAWRRIRGRSAMVLNHSCSTALMALAS